FGPGRAADEEHRADTGRAVERQEQQVRPRAGQLHVGTGETCQALRGDTGGDARESAEQDVLGCGCCSFLRLGTLAGHRSDPEYAVTSKLNFLSRPSTSVDVTI